MAEIRINATGGVKLYDADDSHYAQIVAGTITSNVDAITLAHDSVTLNDNLVLGSDSAVIKFGADSEITLTHSADTGLNLKHTATADDKPIVLTLQTGETDMAANDVIGTINFQAPDEGTGTDAILVAAGISAISEGNFSSSANATKLSFKTAASEAAAEKMSLSSAGLLTVADDIVFKDGGTIGVSSATDAMTVSSGGIVTFKDDILIKDGGTIGAASDADSIAIASNGVVTFTQAPVFPDGSLALADLDIDGGTDIGAAIVDADLFIVDDGAGGTNRKTTASRIKTYIGGGLTEADHWTIGSDVNMTASSETTLTSWSRVTANGSAGNSLLGTGLSHSSGVFSFPSTGYWWIRLETDAFADAAEAVSQYLIINTTLDNSSYGQAKWAFFGQPNGHYNTFATEFLFDVTNTTNDKFKITYYTTQTNNLRGGTDLLAFRLADT